MKYLKYAIPVVIFALFGIINITHSSPCFVNSGCTGQASVPVGSLLTGSTTNQSLVVLAPGSGGQVLWIDTTSGRPTWTATSTLGISGGGSLPYGGQQGLFLGNTASGTPAWLTPGYSTVGFLGSSYTATGTNDNIGINNSLASTTGVSLVRVGTYNSASGTTLQVLSNDLLLGEGNGTVVNLATSSNKGLDFNTVSNAGIQNIRFNDLSTSTLGMGITSFRAAQVTNAHNININNISVTNSSGYDLYIVSGGASASTSNVSIQNNFLSANGHQDIIGGGPFDFISSTTDVSILGNTMIQTLQAGGTLNSNLDANCFDMVGVSKILVANNNCRGRIVFGTEKWPNSYSIIGSNILDSPFGDTLVSGQIEVDGRDTSTSTSQNILIHNNLLKNGTIYVDGTVASPLQHSLVTGNSIITSPSTYQTDDDNGINLTNTSYGSVLGNDLTAGDITKTGVKFSNTINSIALGNTIKNFSVGVDLGSGVGNKSIFNNFVNVTTPVTGGSNIIGMDDNGNVAVGTTTYNSRLFVQGASGSVTPLFEVASSSGFTSINVLSNGNTAIGNRLDVLAAATLLHVMSATNGIGDPVSGPNVSSQWPVIVQNLQATNGSSTGIGFAVTNVANAMGGGIIFKRTGGTSQGELQFYTRDASTIKQALTISDGQLIGIGTITPTSLLTIQGVSGATTSLFSISSSSGASYAYVDFTGNVGIGTTSPSQLFDVEANLNGTVRSFLRNSSSGTSAETGFQVNNNTGSGIVLQQYGSANTGTMGSNPVVPLANYSRLRSSSASAGLILVSASTTGPLILGTADTEKAIIDSSGRFGIGTSTLGGMLSVQSIGGQDSLLFSSSSGTTQFIIKSSGNVGIGTSTPGYKVVNTGTEQLTGLTTSSGLQTAVLCLNAANEVISDSVACLASSERFKQNITPLNNSLSEIMKFNPVSFFYKPEFNGPLQTNPNYNGPQVGLIAEQVQKIDPRLVVVETATSTDGSIINLPGQAAGVRYENIVAIIIKAIQELENKIEDIVKRIDSQDAKIKALEDKANKQQQQIDLLNKEVNALMK